MILTELPSSDALRRVADEIAHADELPGECGMWVFTTQRALSLAWGARASEIYQRISELHDLSQVGSVCCTWADSRALADDGSGWTRYVPSLVQTLIIVTQADIPDMCLVYHSVLNAHLNAGCTVITFMPDIGQMTVTVPRKLHEHRTISSDILVVPRIRRSTAYASYLMLPHNTSYEAMEKMAALRMDPSEQQQLLLELSKEELRHLSAERVLTEAECRTTTASWEILLEHGLKLTDWASVEHGLEQLAIVKAILRSLRAFTGNPLLRRQLLYFILENETQQGESLPGELPNTVSQIVESLRSRM